MIRAGSAPLSRRCVLTRGTKSLRRSCRGETLTEICGFRPRAAHADLLRACGGDHPVADRLDQAGLLGDGDELARRHQRTELAVVPAQQRLDADHPAPAREDRLVVQLELLGHERAPQARGQREPLERVALGLGVDRPAAARDVLGPVHRRVGSSEQRLGVVRVASQRDPDRGGDLELGAGDHERLREAVADLRRHPLGGLERVAGQAGQQHEESVAAGAREQVGRADRALEPPREAADQLVAGRMPERVVDELEVVEVELEQRDAGARSRRARQRELELLLEERAVGEAGERVVVGEIGDLLLGEQALGHVLARRQRAADRAVGIAQHGVVPGDRAQRAGPREHGAVVALDQRHRALNDLVEGAAQRLALGLRNGDPEPVHADQLVL